MLARLIDDSGLDCIIRWTVESKIWVQRRLISHTLMEEETTVRGVWGESPKQREFGPEATGAGTGNRHRTGSCISVNGVLS
jgi:hypothetical protein